MVTTGIGRVLQRAATGVVDGAAYIGTRTLGGPATGRLAEGAADLLRYVAGHLDGVRYRALGHTPDPDVSDDVLADRIRSELGPVLKRRDLPHPNVLVEDGVAILHGEVGTPADALAVIEAVHDVSGVRDVRSNLHVGWTQSETRPSRGRTASQMARSPVYERIVAAGRAAGLQREVAEPTAWAVVRTFLARLPEGERGHVRQHLPQDALALVDLKPAPTDTQDLRTVADFTGAVAGAVPGVTVEQAEDATVAVLKALREAVPEEAMDVRAVLPAGLRGLWDRVAAGL